MLDTDLIQFWQVDIYFKISWTNYAFHNIDILEVKFSESGKKHMEAEFSKLFRRI